MAVSTTETQLASQPQHASNLFPLAPTWQQISATVREERDKTIRRWAMISMSKTTISLPPPDLKNVKSWPKDCGDLTPRQIEITECIPSVLVRRIASGEWSSVEVITAFIARAIIAHFLTNPLAEVFFDRGLKRAQELDDHLDRTKQTVGPLHGLPISLKDVMDVEGISTTLGFVSLAESRPSSSDDLVTKLQAAGAVFYCKTNVPQSLMSGECSNYLYGRTSTPFNTDLSAGGSSGGEGSLLALGGSALGIGTDIAGSIRTPANFNGIYGLCPSFGRFPAYSAAKSGSVSSINGVAGPLSRSIDGLEFYTRTLLSLNPPEWDSSCAAIPWNESQFQDASRNSGRKLCFGMIPNDGVVTPHPPIQRGMREVKEALLKAGHEVIEMDFFDGDDHIWELMTKIFCSSGDQWLQSIVSRLQEPFNKEMLLPTENDRLQIDEFSACGKQVRILQQKYLDRWRNTAHLTSTGKSVDAFILPSGGHVAPPHGTMTYFLYEAISNLLDWTCAMIPVSIVDPILDAIPTDSNQQWKPLSKLDTDNWQEYSPEAFANAPVCLQVLGQRFTEEKVLGCLTVIDEALGRNSDHVA